MLVIVYDDNPLIAAIIILYEKTEEYCKKLVLIIGKCMSTCAAQTRRHYQ